MIHKLLHSATTARRWITLGAKLVLESRAHGRCSAWRCFVRTLEPKATTFCGNLIPEAVEARWKFVGRSVDGFLSETTDRFSCTFVLERDPPHCCLGQRPDLHTSSKSRRFSKCCRWSNTFVMPQTRCNTATQHFYTPGLEKIRTETHLSTCMHELQREPLLVHKRSTSFDRNPPNDGGKAAACVSNKKSKHAALSLCACCPCDTLHSSFCTELSSDLCSITNSVRS